MVYIIRLTAFPEKADQKFRLSRAFIYNLFIIG